MKNESQSEVVGITVDEEMHRDLLGWVNSSEMSNHVDNLPENSFPQLFWKQQCDATSKNDHRSIH